MCSFEFSGELPIDLTVMSRLLGEAQYKVMVLWDQRINMDVGWLTLKTEAQVPAGDFGRHFQLRNWNRSPQEEDDVMMGKEEKVPQVIVGGGISETPVTHQRP